MNNTQMSLHQTLEDAGRKERDMIKNQRPS